MLHQECKYKLREGHNSDEVGQESRKTVEVKRNSQPIDIECLGEYHRLEEVKRK